MTAFNQNFNTYPSDVTSPVFTILDDNGAPVNISGVSDIRWTAQRAVNQPIVLSKTKVAGQITFISGGTTGQFQVNLLAADTAALTGVYLHQALLIDGLGNQSTVTLGQMTVGRPPTWSYDATQLGTSPSTGNPKDQVRRLIGDTKYSDQQLWDEEINFALAQRGYVQGAPSSGIIYAAAADCCRDLGAEYARLVDITQGELRTNYSSKSKSYLSMAANYEVKASARAVGIGVYCGGISIADKIAHINDADRTSPSFAIGMTDNLRIAGPIGPEQIAIPAALQSDLLPE
jgi:hypothetical protein